MATQKSPISDEILNVVRHAVPSEVNWALHFQLTFPEAILISLH